MIRFLRVSRRLRMVRRMKSSGRVIRSFRLIAGLTLLSRVLGLVRECVFGYFFSTSSLMSAFRIAFMVPNLARRLFGEGAMSAALVPTLTEHLVKEGEAVSRRFLGGLMTLVAAVLAGAVLLVEAVLLVGGRWWGDPAIRLSVLLLPYMPLICLTAVAGAALNVRRHFAMPAASPVILNVCIVVGTLLGARLLGLEGHGLMIVVCLSILVAGAGQLASSVYVLRRESFSPVLTWRFGDSRIRGVFRLMGPMVLGMSAVQLNTLADYLIAYLVVSADGVRVGPAVLGYAHYLYQLPLGVFGISLATAVFPDLASKASTDDREGLARTVTHGLQVAVFMALPASVGIGFVAGPLVKALYERGEFEAASTQRVASTLVFYSLGLAAYFALHILVRTFYALQDSRSPARVAGIMVIVNFAMNLALVFVLEERGLALATSICAFVQSLWLGRLLGRRLTELSWRPFWRGVSRTGTATLFMGVVLACLSQGAFGGTVASSAASMPAVVQLGVLVIAGAMAFALAAWSLGCPELHTLRGRSLHTVPVASGETA